MRSGATGVEQGVKQAASGTVSAQGSCALLLCISRLAVNFSSRTFFSSLHYCNCGGDGTFGMVQCCVVATGEIIMLFP